MDRPQQGHWDQSQNRAPEQHLHLEHLWRVAVLYHAFRVPAGEQRLPEADEVFAAAIFGQIFVVDVFHFGCGCKDEPIALGRNAEAQFLILDAGGGEDGVEAAVFAENVSTVGRRVGVDEVDALLTVHAVVAIFVFGLYKKRCQRRLPRGVDALGPSHRRVDEDIDHGCHPIGVGRTVGVGEEEQRRLGFACAVVTRRARTGVGLTHQPPVTTPIFVEPALHHGVGVVGGTIAYDDHLEFVCRKRLRPQCVEATLNRPRAVVDGDDD